MEWCRLPISHCLNRGASFFGFSISFNYCKYFLVAASLHFTSCIWMWLLNQQPCTTVMTTTTTTFTINTTTLSRLAWDLDLYTLCSFMYWTAAYRKCQTTDVFCNQPGGLPPSDGSRLSGPCVPMEKRCDGYLDCRNGRDEEGCKGTACRLDQFRCANGLKCISASLKCNHKDDCGDNSDEQGCSKYSLENAFHS